MFLMLQNNAFLLLCVQVFKGHCQDTGRELAVKIVRDLNDKVVTNVVFEILNLFHGACSYH